ncbi:MAG TPA: hypothetical protein VGL61_02110 [Kofleriaceae bacterium]|jgi:hypothetical protein
MQPGQPQQQYGHQPLQYQQPPPPQQPPLNPRLQEALGGVDLLQGEQIFYTLQADGFFMGANPLAKLMAAVTAFLVAITGGHVRIFLIVTNQRLLMLGSRAVWCGCGRAKIVQSFALASIKEVASVKETQACCIHTRLVQVHSMTERKNLVIKQLGDDEIRRFLTNLSGVIVANSSRAGM